MARPHRFIPLTDVVAIHNVGRGQWEVSYDADGSRHALDVDEMTVQRMFEDGDLPVETS